MKIVEGPTPSLPEPYSRLLNSLMQSMLEKDSSRRISAADALRSRFVEESLQSMKHKFFSLTLRDKSMGEERDASQILRALQKKVHLQTLRERSEVQKMSPRERMRLRKLQVADEKARKLKIFGSLSHVGSDSLCNVRTEEADNQTQPISSETPDRNSELSGSISQKSDKMCKSVSKDHGEWYL
ncbi:Serine/threonine-protein kinase Nek11 [Labeo rohita]|uniref:Serine/threonine-protein kinase Nek11 n=1 Tax=Labeo rohita TaxID=84645 RepID=A0ABQ8LWH8_LABRO|nr:Serine/threonine-protein kinase Nek11 [Labeo rohita]